MIDTNLLNTASNLLVQAGYTIKAAPTPPAPIDYTQLASLITTAILAPLAAVAGVACGAAVGSRCHRTGVR
ncbi:MAG TPA: hypothetical protein VMQ76_13100 [Terracidiphilus sp.]|nr:hypothetical protein [Terracidiphilus sp.]